MKIITSIFCRCLSLFSTGLCPVKIVTVAISNWCDSSFLANIVLCKLILANQDDEFTSPSRLLYSPFEHLTSGFEHLTSVVDLAISLIIRIVSSCELTPIFA